MDEGLSAHCYRRLDRDLRSVREARHLLRELVVERCPGLLMTAELLLTEVITNAVKYQTATGSWVAFEYRWDEPTLRVDVFNPGRVFTAPTAVSLEPTLRDPVSWSETVMTGVDTPAIMGLAESGRGLRLVDSMAAEWGMDAVGPQSTSVPAGEVCRVWFSCVERAPAMVDLFAADIDDLLA